MGTPSLSICRSSSTVRSVSAASSPSETRSKPCASSASSAASVIFVTARSSSTDGSFIKMPRMLSIRVQEVSVNVRTSISARIVKIRFIRASLLAHDGQHPASAAQVFKDFVVGQDGEIRG